jgi:hypothetical protein
MQEITEGAVAFVLFCFFNMEDSSLVLFFMSTFLSFLCHWLYIDKKENKIFFICKKIRRDRVQSHI